MSTTQMTELTESTAQATPVSLLHPRESIAPLRLRLEILESRNRNLEELVLRLQSRLQMLEARQYSLHTVSNVVPFDRINPY